MRVSSCLLTTLLVAALGGCGGTGEETVRVVGKVTYDGVPVNSGDIRFVPERGSDNRTVGSQIEEGEYVLQGKLALRPGDYQVEVVGYRNRDGSATPIDRGDAEADYERFLPAKYNDASQLSFTLKPGSPGEVRHDLVLDK
ncbi:MAG: hypothetical protein ACR2NU_01005 [Aeoliella sp.]